MAYNSVLMAYKANTVAIIYKDLPAIKDEDFIYRPLSPQISDLNTIIWKKNTQLSALANKFLTEVKRQLL